LLLLAGLAAACGTPGRPHARQSCEHVTMPVPPSVAGYTVAEETRIEPRFCTGDPAAMITGGALYSLRVGRTLHATLEVARFKPGVNTGAASFQPAIVGQIGQSVMRRQQIGGQPVWIGAGAQGVTIVWFKGRLLHVLLTHDVADPQALAAALVVLP
jgi:hypothetical protein